MEKNKTSRGFSFYEFIDSNGVACSIQKSSIATEDRIWLGADNIGLKEFNPGKGWNEIPLDGRQVVANNRMHLTQDQVKHLLPILIRFVETGEI